MADDEAPRDMKTAEKPKMNARELVIVRKRILVLSEPAVSSSNEMPVIKETYDGTSGSTHGERKDSTPARKETEYDTSFIAHIPPANP
jgi:hypothetical protein